MVGAESCLLVDILKIQNSE